MLILSPGTTLTTSEIMKRSTASATSGAMSRPMARLPKRMPAAYTSLFV